MKAKAVGRPIGDVAKEWADQFKNTPPAGINYQWGGDMENQEEGFGTLGIALLALSLIHI